MTRYTNSGDIFTPICSRCSGAVTGPGTEINGDLVCDACADPLPAYHMPKPLYDALASLAAAKGLTQPSIILAAQTQRRARTRPVLWWTKESP